MGLGDFFRRLFGPTQARTPTRIWLAGSERDLAPDRGFDVEELARRLAWDSWKLRLVTPHYREFEIPKRSGGTRSITPCRR